MNQDIFGPYDRGDGKQVYADPFEIDAALREAMQADYSEVQRQAVSDEPGALQAKKKLVMGTRKAFGLAPFDPQTGRGYTGARVIEVWNAWADYCVKKNGNPGTGPTSPPPASAPQTTPPSPSGSASGSGFIQTG